MFNVGYVMALVHSISFMQNSPMNLVFGVLNLELLLHFNRCLDFRFRRISAEAEEQISWTFG